MNDTFPDDILLLKQCLAEQAALIHALQKTAAVADHTACRITHHRHVNTVRAVRLLRAQHWLVCGICSHSHASFSCRDSVIHFLPYCHRKRVSLAWRRLSAGSRGDGFYPPLQLAVSPHGSGQRRFYSPHRADGCGPLLYNPAFMSIDWYRRLHQPENYCGKNCQSTRSAFLCSHLQ